MLESVSLLTLQRLCTSCSGAVQPKECLRVATDHSGHLCTVWSVLCSAQRVHNLHIVCPPVSIFTAPSIDGRERILKRFVSEKSLGCATTSECDKLEFVRVVIKNLVKAALAKRTMCKEAINAKTVRSASC